MRAPTFFQRSRDQQWYIHQLQALHSQYAAQISELRSRLPGQQPLSDLNPQTTQPQPMPMPRLRSSRRLQADCETVESGRLSSTSESEGESSEVEESLGESTTSVEHPLAFSELESLTEQNYEFKNLLSSSLPASTELFRSPKESPAAWSTSNAAGVGGGEAAAQVNSHSGRSSALEDELMLLRLLDLHKTSRDTPPVVVAGPEAGLATQQPPENDAVAAAAASLTSIPLTSESPQPGSSSSSGHIHRSAGLSETGQPVGPPSSSLLDTLPTSSFFSAESLQSQGATSLCAEKGDLRAFEPVTRDCMAESGQNKIAPRPSLAIDDIGTTQLFY